MDQRNQGNNNNRNVAATVAGVAVGAAAVYGAFKLFESMFGSEEPQQNRLHDNPMKRPEQFYQNHFRRNQEVHVVNTVEECRYSMEQIKSLVENILIFLKIFHSNQNLIIYLFQALQRIQCAWF